MLSEPTGTQPIDLAARWRGGHDVRRGRPDPEKI
jgi:hypothetical protein